MIPLSDITAALAARISAGTGVFAIDERLRTTVYPSYYISALPRDLTVIAGGRQVLRQVEVRICCHCSRQREDEGQRDMTEALYSLLLPAFPACGRSFCPTQLTVEQQGEDMLLSFRLEFCDLPPGQVSHNTEHMEALSLTLRRAEAEE